MMDRRQFLATGAGFGVGGAAIAHAEPMVAAAAARLHEEFGIKPDPRKDQGAALQAAFDQAGRAGRPFLLPAGQYRTERTLTLPQGVSLFGMAGASVITGAAGVLLRPAPGGVHRIEGVSFAVAPEAAAQTALATFEECDLVIETCSFSGGGGLELTKSRARIAGSHFRAMANGLVANRVRGIMITGCRFEDIGNRAITVMTAEGALAAQIVCNTIERSRAAGIVAGGGAIVSGNVVRECGFGLILGGETVVGGIAATHNHVSGCAIGIGCSGVGEYVFVSLNMITGARNGAIRALIDGKPSGPDLTQGSAEAFRNLAIAGNVAL
jgi:hypothetical protein